ARDRLGSPDERSTDMQAPTEEGKPTRIHHAEGAGGVDLEPGPGEGLLDRRDLSPELLHVARAISAGDAQALAAPEQAVALHPDRAGRVLGVDHGDAAGPDG